MKNLDVADDTIPCPPLPDSGDYPVVQIEVDPIAKHVAPHYVESVVAELRGLLAGLQCPDHRVAPVVHVEFGSDDDAAVAVVPHDCCPRLHQSMAHALRGVPIFRLVVPQRA